MAAPSTAFSVDSEGVRLSGEYAGDGVPVVLLHGLTATRRYVVMGSRSLERGGHRVIAFDARGHGRSSPPPEPRAYGYEHLSADLQAVLDGLGVERAVLAGASMGAHTAVSLTLRSPERVAALGLITPSYDPSHARTPESFSAWDALARGLRGGGVEGFLDAYDLTDLPGQWRDTVEKVIRQRLAAHEHPRAVADALEAVPRSSPFQEMGELRAIAVPTVVVASRDLVDPGHPLAVGESYARAIPGARMIVEAPSAPPDRASSSPAPIAWQGGQLSRIIAELAALAH
ncbi:MAG: alpha/beta hydrolase [Actinomycetota bacterium]|nr:alpha/beta hydrolase [Actinomycetota bacterium]